MSALCDEQLLTDTFPPITAHNIGARLLRHGLAVTAFSSLEKYIAKRFEELATSIESCAIPYPAFSDDLKSFLTKDAAHGLLNRVGFMEAALKQSYFDNNISKIAAYLTAPPKYTSFGFVPRGSNVSKEHIKNALRAFGLKDGWGNLKIVTQEIGSGRVDLLADYSNLSSTRHKSAHDPESNVPTNNLKTHIEITILIGIAIDILTTNIAVAYKNATSASDLLTRLTSLTRNYRFVDLEIGGTFVERASLTGRIVKRYPTEADATAGALARNGFAFVVLRSPTTTPLALAGT